MEILGRLSLQQTLDNMKTFPGYKNVLSVLLKYEIQLLLERLAETGEESVVMTTSIEDGTLSVIGSNCGEKFISDQDITDQDVITNFKQHFRKYCQSTQVEARESSTSPSVTGDKSMYVNNEANPSIATVKPNKHRASPKVVTESNALENSISNFIKSTLDESEKTESSDVNINISSQSPTVSDNYQASSHAKKLVSNVLTNNKSRKPRSRSFHSHWNEMSSRKLASDRHSNSSSSLPDCYKEPRHNVDETVSQLVKNIMKTSEQKEKQSLARLINNGGGSQGRRKRTVYYHDDGPIAAVNDYISKHKKSRRISDCFPPLSTSQQTWPTSESESESAGVVIKTEPEDYTIFETIGDEMRLHEAASQEKEAEKSSAIDSGSIKHPSTSRASWETEKVDIMDTNGDVNSKDVDKNVDVHVENRVVEVDTDAAPVVDICIVKQEPVDENDEIELPMVEEFYENREKETETFQLKENEISSLDTDMKAEELNKTYEIGYSPNTQPLIHGGYTYRKDGFKFPSTYWKYGFYSSPKGKYNLMYKGYVYMKDKVGRNDTVYWKCGRSGCKGRVIQRGHERIITKEHTHSPLRVAPNKPQTDGQ